MRLGKTLVAIRWLQRACTGRVLVVAPLSALRDWQAELLLEGEDSVALLAGSSEERASEFSLNRRWNLIGFESLLVTPSLLSDYRWDCFVVDESTRVRNPKAKVVQLLVRYRSNANRRAILSGSPAPEGPQDYAMQFIWLVGHFCGFASFWHLRNAYFTLVAGIHKWVPKPFARAKMLDFVRTHAFVRSRKDVGLANEKVYQRRTVRMESEQKRLMERLEDEFVLETPTGTKETKWVPVKHIWMSRLAGGYTDGKKWFDGKFDLLMELMEGELKGEKVVVWFRFNNEMQRAKEFLEKAGIVAGIMDGTTGEEERFVVREHFNKGSVQVLLVQVKLGLYSLNLSAASTAIYFSCSHSLLERLQSEDRIEHMEKKEPLLYIDLTTEDTPDEDVYSALRRKETDMRYYLGQKIGERVARRRVQGCPAS